jgi:6-hydroxynicotinate 3-monooxygenase
LRRSAETISKSVSFHGNDDATVRQKIAAEGHLDMVARALSVAVIGAGIGGLTAAAALRRAGLDVEVFEQAKQFTRLGAGIQQTPNAVMVLRALGLEERLRTLGYQPSVMHYRDAVSGEILWEKAQGRKAEEQFGAPHLLLHRGDLHEALASLVPPELVHLDRKLSSFEQNENGVRMQFEDGSTASADMMIAADGVHSLVRETLFGPEKPRYTGRVAYRTVFPSRLLNGANIDGSAKWIGADRHIVIYYVNANEDEIYFVTSTPEPDFSVESWSAAGDMDTLRSAYRGFHPQVRTVLDACPAAHKWAIIERDPMPCWTDRRVALLGDACHPMTPYVAQGAASAIEDAAVLARCLKDCARADIEAALLQYAQTRQPRTARIQTLSSLNSVDRLRQEYEAIYGYDTWTAPLAARTEQVPAGASKKGAEVR